MAKAPQSKKATAPRAPVEKPQGQKPVPAPVDRQNLSLSVERGESPYAAVARTGMSPSVTAVGTVMAYQGAMPKDFVSADDLRATLTSEAAKVQAGDLSRQEEMLSAHAHTLDLLFNHLALRAHRNMDGGNLQAADTYMRMALKAQSQCRTTIEALAEVKFPKSATFIRQTNIAQQQQVNNGTAPAAGTTARPQEKNVTPTNELLEATHGERLDTGATSKAGGSNPQLETVGAVKRTKK